MNDPNQSINQSIIVGCNFLPSHFSVRYHSTFTVIFWFVCVFFDIFYHVPEQIWPGICLCSVWSESRGIVYFRVLENCHHHMWRQKHRVKSIGCEWKNLGGFRREIRTFLQKPAKLLTHCPLYVQKCTFLWQQKPPNAAQNTKDFFRKSIFPLLAMPVNSPSRGGGSFILSAGVLTRGVKYVRYTREHIINDIYLWSGRRLH